MAKAASSPLADLRRLARLIYSGEHDTGLNPAQWEALRYLAVCNRFSNSPSALTEYLCATKGTVSQTVNALERKGLLVKRPRPNERRSVALTVSEAGEELLRMDPLAALDRAAADLGDKTRKRMDKGLRTILDAQLRDARRRMFGTCRSCRFFREKGAESHERGPHSCLLFEAPLSKAEMKLLCVEYDPA